MHWQRWRKWGDPRNTGAGRWKLSEEERFWQYVDKTPGCWIWTGGRKMGYGCFSVTRNKQDRMVQAHRFAYELANGPLADNMTLDHLCHTRAVSTCNGGPSCPHRACVRTDHLEPTSLGDNIRRGGNSAKTHCKRGHEFTPENTYAMKRGGRSCKTCLRLHAANLRARRRPERQAP